MLRENFDTVTDDGWTTSGLNVQFKQIGDTLLVQCTCGFSDWMFNLFAAKVEYDEHGTKVKAHAGFAAMWLSIRADIEKLTFTKLILYSEGSAIGTAIHFNYKKRFGIEPDSNAFGTPRYFAKSSEEEVKDCFTKFKRFKNRWDVVTHTPFESMGFIHVGEEIILPAVKFSERPKGIRGFIEWVVGHSQKIYRIATAKYDEKWK